MHCIAMCEHSKGIAIFFQILFIVFKECILLAKCICLVALYMSIFCINILFIILKEHAIGLC